MPRLLLALLVLAGCSRAPNLVEGGIYSVEAEAGRYGVVKILKVDKGGVHVRSYSNTFPARPVSVDASKLYMAGVDHKPGESLGVGHLPLSHDSFRGWRAEYIQTEPVREEELEGYRMWVEAKGGYF